MSMDFESWRCMHDETLFCPPEGCSKRDGCARDKGWHPAMTQSNWRREAQQRAQGYDGAFLSFSGKEMLRALDAIDAAEAAQAKAEAERDAALRRNEQHVAALQEIGVHVERAEAEIAELRQQLAECQDQPVCPRGGRVMRAVLSVLPPLGEFCISGIKSQVPASAKEISNAMGYLTRHGYLRRLGYGRYVAADALGRHRARQAQEPKP
jgi:hypothetical protein